MFLGQVMDDRDSERSGLISVKIDGYGGKTTVVPVVYNSLAGGPLGGGLSAPVERDSLVLVAAPDNSDYLFYMGTVQFAGPRANPATYKGGDKMTSIGLTTKEGAGVTVDVEVSESDMQNITRLKGQGGAGQVTINNYPGNESVTLQAQGMNTSIKANGFSNTKPDQIEISAANSVTSRARNGSNYINVGPKGGELKLHNEGTQANPLRPAPLGLFNGDIRIESENNNVVIKSCTDPVLVGTDPAEGAGVTIQAGSVPNPLVEIRVDSQGFVNIKGALGIRMESGANIDMTAVGQVNIKGAQVNLQPTPLIAPMPPIPPAKR